MNRDYRKYFTPEKEADELIELGELSDGMSLLEPSAGQGDIIKVAMARNFDLSVDAVESNKDYVPVLYTIPGICVHVGDFLDYPLRHKFNRIIANPPFTNDIWFLHLVKMYEHLHQNGILVCVAPKFAIKEYNIPWLDTHGAFAQALHNKTMTRHAMKNWATNSDGSFTEIQVIKWRKE